MTIDKDIHAGSDSGEPREEGPREARTECPFCEPEASRIFLEDELVIGLWDAFPVSQGHALLVPRRHVADWFAASDEERLALTRATERAKEIIEERHHPSGYNIGINVGLAAGQTVFHLHVHVIPRYEGDVEDPTGGVRGVIPAKANYRRGGEGASGNPGHPPSPEALERQSGVLGVGGSQPEARRAPPAPNEAPPRLTLGGERPLLPWLKRCFAAARSADIAVSFVQKSGLEALRSAIEDFLERPGTRLRLVTGDYLGITDPDALARLLDLAEEFPSSASEGDATKRAEAVAVDERDGKSSVDAGVFDDPAPRGSLDIRVFSPSDGQGFHPKAYMFSFANGATRARSAALVTDSISGDESSTPRVAYLGSANLSGPALGWIPRSGAPEIAGESSPSGEVPDSRRTAAPAPASVEWCYRIEDERDPAGLDELAQAFEDLWRHEATVPLTYEWLRTYRERRAELAFSPPRTRSADSAADSGTLAAVGPAPRADILVEPPEEPSVPHDVQEEALEALALTRERGNRKGLVVMATGLGKTWLAAFDVRAFGAKRTLFVAHREEILRQARDTFRKLMPAAKLGFYTGRERASDLDGQDVLFASVQTLARKAHLERIEPDAFDYVVVDEFHHAAAKTYRRLLRHLAPGFLLGLTATPERLDGGNLLALCGENLVYRCDIAEAIWRGLLCPFKYLGVPDHIDYTNIPWRNRRFDERALTEAWATSARADNALELFKKHGGRRMLGFCSTVEHARFMARHFSEHSQTPVKAVAVHSAADSAPRRESLERLEAGELEAIFSVDMFNEGVDLPAVDTVMMLRPTASPVIFIQQIGRGLRKARGKESLQVIDYIGNHRAFLVKPETLLDVESSRPGALREALHALDRGQLELPPGCEVTYELEVMEMLQRLAAPQKAVDVIRAWYRDWRERHGERPRALEVFHAGISMSLIKKHWSSWFGLVRSEGDLEADERELLGEYPRAAAFVRELESTQMTKSYKMVLLAAAMEEGGLPNSVPIDDVARRAYRLIHDSEALRTDWAERAASIEAVRKCLVENPIHFLMQGKGMGGENYFTLEEERFGLNIEVPDRVRGTLKRLVEEIIEWRLGEYLERESRHRDESPEGSSREAEVFFCKVFWNQRHPIIKLDRQRYPSLPSGPQSIVVEGRELEGNLAKIALNALREPGRPDNVMPAILQGWFGPSAGHPGTAHYVRIVRRGEDVPLFLDLVPRESK